MVESPDSMSHCPRLKTALMRESTRAALARVLHASAKLSPVDRIVFFERVLEERSYQQIAQRNSLSVAAVKVKVYRARLKLMMAR